MNTTRFNTGYNFLITALRSGAPVRGFGPFDRGTPEAQGWNTARLQAQRVSYLNTVAAS